MRLTLVSILLFGLVVFFGACSTSSDVAEEGETPNKEVSQAPQDTGKALSDLEATLDQEAESSKKTLEGPEPDELENSVANNNNPPVENVEKEIPSAPAPVIAENETPAPTLQEDAPAPKPKKTFKPKKHKANGKSLAFEPLPQIPGKALTVGDVKLNRFYFVRSGDTPEKLSDLIYGTPNKANQLKEWNKSLKTGEIIFYETPFVNNANDLKMKSFFQERGVPAQEYPLGKKENLLTAAKKLLGDKKSWKEIALLNGFDYPETIGEGQKVIFYPKDLSQYHFKPNEVAVAPVVDVAPKELTPSENNPLAPAADSVAENEPVKKEKPKKSEFNLQKLIEQNLFAIATAGVICGCLLGLAMIRRRRKKEDDVLASSEDESSFTAKKRRKG